MRQLAVAVLFASLASIESVRADDDASGDKQVVLVNATSKSNALPGIDRVRRVLDGRGMIFKLPASIVQLLDGTNLAVTDLDQIRGAMDDSDFKEAKRLIDADEKRVLASVGSGDPVPALAELSQWRGLIATLDEGDTEEAVSWFRAAVRFNPMWEPRGKFASAPSIKKLFQEAKKDPSENGKLRVDATPSDARVRIDGKENHASGEKIELPIGVHLVVVSAPDRSPYATLAHVKQGATVKLPVELAKESKDDRAGRLLEATVSEPSGKSRLKAAKPLAKLISATRLLYFEDSSEDKLVLRMYDVDAQKVSKQFDLDSSTPSTAITRKVLAALDFEGGGEPVGGGGGPEGPTPWFKRWYVWVGVAVVAGVAIGGYELANRSPTSVRF